ncbi:hypothetical protein JCM5296_000799 [Sporobolomyces johnsonii]
MPPTNGGLAPWLARGFLSQRNALGATLAPELIKEGKRLQLVKVLGETEADGEKLLWVQMGDGELQIDCCLPLSFIEAYDEDSAKSFCASSPLKDIFRLRAWRFLLACPASPLSNPHRSPSKSVSEPTFARPTLSRRVCIRIDALELYGGTNQTIIVHEGRELVEFRKDQKHAGLREWNLKLESGGSGEKVSFGQSDAAGSAVVYEGDLPNFAPKRRTSPPAPRPSTSTLPAPKPSASITTANPAARIITPFDWDHAAKSGLWPLRNPDYSTREDAEVDVEEEVAAPVARRLSTLEVQPTQPPQFACSQPSAPPFQTPAPTTSTWLLQSSQGRKAPRASVSAVTSSQRRHSASPHSASTSTTATTTTTSASVQPKSRQRSRASAPAALHPASSSVSASISHLPAPPAAQPMDATLPTSSQYAALGGDSTDVEEEISVASWTEGQPVGNQEQARREDEGTQEWIKVDEEERILATPFTSTATSISAPTTATNRLLSFLRRPTSFHLPTESAESVDGTRPILPDVQPAASASVSAGVARSTKRLRSSASSSLTPDAAASSSLSPDQQRLVKKARTGAGSPSTCTTAAPVHDLYAAALSDFAAARVARHAREKVESREERRARVARLRMALRG